MTSKHRIVVSAENSAYMGWQCKLFYFSCVTRARLQPSFIVHHAGDPLHQDFRDLVRAGARVSLAPSYANGPHGWYPPRHTPASLLYAKELFAGDEFIVLCDPDMIFVRRPEFPDRLAASFHANVDLDEPQIGPAARRLGVRIGKAQKKQLRCGVPYVVPVPLAGSLANAWLEAVDAFGPPQWMDIMYAYALAVIKLRLESLLMDCVEPNFQSWRPCMHELVHYCWAVERWDKRNFYQPETACRVWEPPDATPGTIAHELFSQIREARRFYGEPLAGSAQLISSGPAGKRTAR